MLTLPVDEILKETEESSMSAGSSGGHYSDGGDGVNEFVGAAVAGATKLLTGLGATAAATKVGSTVVKGGLKKTLTRTGIKLGGKTGGQMVKTAIEKPLQTAANVSYASNMMPQTSSGKDGTKKTSSISASADLFDIVKGKLLDEGLSEDEALDIMLTLPVDEILKETEESSMSAGSSGGHYSDGGDGVNEFVGAAVAGATKLLTGLGATAAATKVGSTVVKGGLKKTLTRTGIKLGGKTGGQMVKTAIEKPLQTAANVSYASNMMPQTSSGKDGTKKTSSISASADLFDIVKGKLLDEGLSEDEALDIMLTLPVDEILKETEESSMSAGSSGGHYSDGGDGVFRSKEQVGRQFNKNFPPAKNAKVDKPTRKAINTSAKDFGIQGPSTLKQSVEPEGETI
jgi:predicted DNA-binding protein